MKVYVIMGNDYPDRVYARKEDADAYCAERLEENRKAREADHMRGRIYWRAYEFDLVEVPN